MSRTIRRIQWILAGVLVVIVSAVLIGVGVILPRPSHTAVPASRSVARSLESLRSSVIEITSTWNGLVTIPEKTGTYTVPVSYSEQCSALFIRTGAHPVLLTSAHCVYNDDIRNSLINQAYFQVPVYAMQTLPPQSSWTLSGANIGPVSANVQLTPTYDSVKAFGKAGVTLSVSSHGLPETDDFATLSASAPIKGARSLAIAKSDPADGSLVVSVGYPGNLGRQVIGQYLEATHTVGYVSSSQFMSSGQPVISITSPLGQGMSGGPTLDRDGNVVGLNMAIADEQSINLITETYTLRDYLAANGIDTGTPSTVPLKVQQ